MPKNILEAIVLVSVLSSCSPVSPSPKYHFFEENGSYDQCLFSGDINGELEFDIRPQPYWSVLGHGYEKKINGLWYPRVRQWRGKTGRVITFVTRDGTGSGDTSGYWYGTMNGERAGGYTIVPRWHWAFKTWNGSIEFECKNPRMERG
jgi:hypothetical protein